MVQFYRTIQIAGFLLTQGRLIAESEVFDFHLINMDVQWKHASVLAKFTVYRW